MQPDQPEPGGPGTARDDHPDGQGGRHLGQAQEEGANKGKGPDSDSVQRRTRTERLAAGAGYREAVDAEYREATDRAAWAEAVPGLRAAWADHQERYPERARATPRTEADGSWVSGEYRRLDPEQNTEASKAHADLADEASRHILPALRRIEAADPDRKLAGLDHMIKGEDRLKEKLADVLLVESHLTARQALERVPDAVRFTLTYSAERYTEGVLSDVARLKAEGFEEARLKNLWDADQYKGINTQWRCRDTGTRFEVQFHTPESLDAKELTHKAYERLRRPVAETTPTERAALEAFQLGEGFGCLGLVVVAPGLAGAPEAVPPRLLGGVEPIEGRPAGGVPRSR